MPGILVGGGSVVGVGEGVEVGVEVGVDVGVDVGVEVDVGVGVACFITSGKYALGDGVSAPWATDFAVLRQERKLLPRSNPAPPRIVPFKKSRLVSFFCPILLCFPPPECLMFP